MWAWHPVLAPLTIYLYFFYHFYGHATCSTCTNRIVIDLLGIDDTTIKRFSKRPHTKCDTINVNRSYSFHFYRLFATIDGRWHVTSMSVSCSSLQPTHINIIVCLYLLPPTLSNRPHFLEMKNAKNGWITPSTRRCFTGRRYLRKYMSLTCTRYAWRATIFLEKSIKYAFSFSDGILLSNWFDYWIDTMSLQFALWNDSGGNYQMHTGRVTKVIIPHSIYTGKMCGLPASW